MFSILEPALNAVLLSETKEITPGMSDVVVRMLIASLVLSVQLHLLGWIFVNDILRIFIQREPKGKQWKVSATFIDFLFLGFYYQPILRLELLRSSTIPTMDESEQHGGEIKKEGTKAENTALKKEETEPLRKRRKKKG